MELSLVSIGIALAAGAASFLSPCLLPLVPLYLGYVTGSTATTVSKHTRLAGLWLTIPFVLGFTIVFVVLGVGAGLAGDLLTENRDILGKIGGILLIVLGLQVSGLITLPVLTKERRIQFGVPSQPSVLSSLLLGFVFALAWTPCVGPTLFGILVLAGASETVLSGAILLLAFSAGIAIPFLLLGTAIDVLAKPLRGLNRWAGIVSKASGAILVALGVLLLLGQISRLTGLFGIDISL